MKYHKIRNVPLTECTAEQFIAYDLSCSYRDIIKRNYQLQPTAIQKDELIQYYTRKLMEYYTTSYTYKPNRYDDDAICCCLRAGLENYINAPYSILTRYDEIGNMFPAYYL